MPLDRTYPIEIARRFAAEDLATPSAAEVERGEEDGLAGNQHYQDLRGVTWQEVAAAVGREAELIARFDIASDLDEEADLLDEERAEAVFPEDDLWGLDVGVAGAAVALSALGATPASSCNAGGFGGQHIARFPYVAFYIGDANPAEILALATDAEIGLDTVDGLGRLYGARDRDLHRFAALALRRHRVGE